MQVLMSVPPGLVDAFTELSGKAQPDWLAACDPPGAKLGSCGGSANLLAEAWRRCGEGRSFADWLRHDPKIMIHAGGQSRRLPAYAPPGKLGLPVPVMRWARGQRLDQTLLDLHAPFCRDIMERAPAGMVAMVASGDVLLRTDMTQLGPIPSADVVCAGLWVSAEQAQNHGVFFCSRGNLEKLDFFLQKPSLDQIHAHSSEHVFLVDSGLWLFSERAIRVLMGKCGWDWETSSFGKDGCGFYELYAGFGLGLGETPELVDAEINSLTTAIMPLPEGEFYHFGTSRELIASSSILQNKVIDQRSVLASGLKPHPQMFILNSVASSSELELDSKNHMLWIENAHVPKTWQLAHEQVITGVPENDWALRLPAGVCLDVVPVDDELWGVRVYGFDDPFRGPIGESATLWCGEPATAWFERRGLSLDLAGISPDSDLQQCALFPVLTRAEMTAGFVQWLINGAGDEGHSSTWLAAERLSAEALAQRANLRRSHQQRCGNRRSILPVLAANTARSIFYTMDLQHTALEYALTQAPVPPAPAADHAPLMHSVHHAMFQAAVGRQRGEADWEAHEVRAFAMLRDAMVAPLLDQPFVPRSTLLDDQIIWARSPIRLDLAGGWTDTPPHCLTHGGSVVNIAANLNGQPPIQVFIRKCSQLHIVLRSIDLGAEECITSYEQLSGCAVVGGVFSIAKAALALAGFVPQYTATKHASLVEQLRDFGGGIEISLLAAVPKGSGLGTSSILSSTLIGALSDLCGFNWGIAQISQNVLVVEQLLTTGGGWQDQVGGVTRGVKLVETVAGLEQIPVIRWLPDHLFTDTRTQACMLLYYTGITRVAKNILKEIVRGMFLNNQEHEQILSDLAEHAMHTHDVIVRDDWDGLCRCIDHSWQLNQRLDAGTNPPETQAILARVQDHLAGAKLLGAGGGGYLLMLAKDQGAASRIRQELSVHPPNNKARFVDFSVSTTGLEITRS